MKFLFSNAVLGTILLSSRSAAFTSPRSPLPSARTATKLQARAGARTGTELQSTLVEEIDAIAVPAIQPEPATTQQLIEEEQEVVAPPEDKSYLDDGFVFGLDGSGLDRPKGKVVSLVYEGDSVETTPLQLGMVSATFAGQAAIAAHAVAALFQRTDGNLPATAAIAAATVVASWLAADFGSGVLHWSVDNYGNGRTPVMGNIIAAFQGHHSAPWTITYRGFANNVWKLCLPFGVPTVAAITWLAGPEHPMVSLFFAVFCASEILSQEFHKWSHQSKKEVPAWVNALQDAGVSIGRAAHNKHHIAPYDGNYCIVSGRCNRLLDESGFFRWLEHRIYNVNGVESNSWKLDAALRERTLRGDYRLPKKLRSTR